MKSGMIVRNISIFLIMGLLITSCNKDDDKDAQDDLIGTWNVWASNFNTSVGDTTLTQYLIDSLGMSADQAQIYTTVFNSTLQQSISGTLTFKSDNTYTSTLGGQTDTGTWSLSNDRKKLTMTSTTNSTPIQLDVVMLTNENLEVSFTETDSVDLNEDTVPEIITVKANLKLVKQ